MPSMLSFHPSSASSCQEEASQPLRLTCVAPFAEEQSDAFLICGKREQKWTTNASTMSIDSVTISSFWQEKSTWMKIIPKLFGKENKILYFCTLKKRMSTISY